MEEQKSIFSDASSTFSSRNFYSIAQWSKFIGIIMLLGSGAILVLGFIFRSMTEDIFGIVQTTVLFPFLHSLHNTLPAFWILIIVITSSVIALLGLLFLRISKSSKDYYHTQNSDAFIKMMQAVRWLFLISAMSTVLTSLPSFLGIFGIF